MLKKMLLALVIVCGIAVLVFAYLIAKQHRDAAYLIKVLQQVQVGHSRIEDIAPDLRSVGAVAGVRGGMCEAELNGPASSTTRHSPGASSGSPSAQSSHQRCGYNVFLGNKVLHTLRLAPQTGISVSIETNDGTVDQVFLTCWVGEFANIGLVDFLQVAGKRPECGQETCIQRSYGSDRAVVKVRIQVADDVPAAERNRLLSINTHCLSKIGGCKNAAELLPISE
jgi:hypothetical protein